VTIDVHAHAVIPRYQQLLADKGIVIPGYGAGAVGSPVAEDAITDGEEAVRRRIALMNEAGVERQLLSAMFAPYLTDEADAVAAARCVNDVHAAMVDGHRDRLGAYAALPLPHMDASIAELAAASMNSAWSVLRCSVRVRASRSPHHDSSPSMKS
jgi:aminocarboxymuconate-semialdehyde decarboxylase